MSERVDTKSKKSFFAKLGPGLITGAADNDPSGIGTYSQVGAQFGYGLLWSLLFSLPLMYAVQVICARIGRTTGHGLTRNLLALYPRPLVGALVALLFLANVFNIGADIDAMGEGVHLLVGGPTALYASILALVCVTAEVFTRYAKYSAWLKWSTLAMFAYVGAAFATHIPWSTALQSTVLPRFSTKGDYWLSLAAVLGTTISPYLFFWQAAQEVEDIGTVPGDKPLSKAPHQAVAQFRRIRLDTLVGMGASAMVAYFIMLTCAATLHAQGITHIDSAAQAAQALRPIAGNFAFVVFAAGIVGTGLLAVPVLAGSASYAVSAYFGWAASLDRPWARAKGFYAVIAISTLLGLAMVFTRIDPFKMLFWSAVINAVAAVPMLILIMMAARSPKVTPHNFKLPVLVKWLGWIAAIVMAAVALAAVVGIVDK